MRSLWHIRSQRLLRFALFLFIFSLSSAVFAQVAPSYTHGWMRLGGLQGSNISGPPSWSPDGSRVAICDYNGVKIVNSSTGILEWIVRCSGNTAFAVFLTNDVVLVEDAFIVTPGNPYRLRWFDLSTHNTTKTIAPPTYAAWLSPFLVLDPTRSYLLVNGKVMRLTDDHIMTLPYVNSYVEGFGPAPLSVYAGGRYTVMEGAVSPDQPLPNTTPFSIQNYAPDRSYGVFYSGAGGYIGTTNGTGIEAFTTASHLAYPTWPRWSSDSKRLVVNAGGYVGIYDLLPGGPALLSPWPLQVSNGGAHLYEWSPDNSKLVDQANNPEFGPHHIMNAQTGALTDISFGYGAVTLVQSLDHSEAAVINQGTPDINREINIFSVGSGAFLRKLPVAGVYKAAYLTSSLLAIARVDGDQYSRVYHVEVINALTGVKQWGYDTLNTIFGLDVVPNKYVFASYKDIAMRRWNVDGTGGTDGYNTTNLHGITVSPDGRRIAGMISGGGFYIVAYDTETLAYQADIRCNNYGGSIAWSPDNNHIVEAFTQTSVAVYDLAAHVSFGTGDGTHATAAAWSPSGTYLALAHHNGTPEGARVTFYSMNGTLLTSVKVLDDGIGESYINSLQFTPDGSGVLFGTYDGTVGRFDTPEPVYVPQKLATLTLSPTSVVGGNDVTGTVTLDMPAGSSAINVSVTSLSALVAGGSTFNVTVPAGAQSAVFTASTSGVAANTTASIRATCNGVTKTASLTLKPAAIKSISLSPASVTGGTSSIATVTLTGKTPTDAAVSLGFAFPASGPASVTIPANNSSASFAVTTVPVTNNWSASVGATFKGLSKSATLSVKSPVLAAFTLSATSVIGGTSLTGTVSLTGPVAADVTLGIGTSDGRVRPQFPIVIHAGESSATFNITTDPVSIPISVTFTAVFGGVTKLATLSLKPAALSSFTLTPTIVKGGLDVVGTVTMTGPVAADTLVTLTNANAKATLPSPTVTIPAGSASVSFTITTMATSANVSGAVKAQVGTVVKSVTLKVTP